MKRVIIDSTKESIQLSKLLRNINNYYIFYRSSSENYPVFLIYRHDLKEWGFSPAFVNRDYFSFTGYTPEQAIANAAKSREILAVHKDKYQDLFKL